MLQITEPCKRAYVGGGFLPTAGCGRYGACRFHLAMAN